MKYYIRGITPKRVMSGWVHLYEETSHRWQAADDTVSDFTDPEIEPQTSRTDSNVVTTELIKTVSYVKKEKANAPRVTPLEKPVW